MPNPIPDSLTKEDKEFLIDVLDTELLLDNTEARKKHIKDILTKLENSK